MARVDLAFWIAVGAGGLALVAASVATVLWMQLGRVRRAQRALLPDGTTGDLVGAQETLGRELGSLQRAVSDLAALVAQQGESTERELKRSLRFQGLVRYDAYRDMGGQQSWSVAFLDGSDNGTVITCLHSRDHARIYLKELRAGVSEQRLSPEEENAIEVAIGRGLRRPAA